ncbi:MAG: hypothetical protein IKW28_02755 [Lachnospiraceae bacterium]|nr:hypothetical protein [Lachnospiraceae bacterium]
MKRNNIKIGKWTVMAAAMVQLLSMVLWKDHSFVAIHDNLDLFVAHNTLMKNEGAFFGQNTTVGMLGGISRDLLGSEFSLYNILYFLFSPYAAYTIGYLLKIVIGFGGFALLLREVLEEKYGEYEELIWMTGMGFGMIPVFPAYGIAFNSLPLLLLLLIKIRREGKWYWYGGLFCYPLLSYFSYFGFFILGFLVIAAIILSIANKKPEGRLLVAVPVLAAGYVCFEYRLFGQILFSDTVTIRESMQLADFSLSQVVKEIGQVFLDPGFHAQDSHKYLILPIVILVLLWDIYRLGKEKRRWIKEPAYLIFCWIVFNCVIYGLYSYRPFRNLFEALLPPLKGFQFNRTIFLNPFLWYLLFFLCLKKVWDYKKESSRNKIAVKLAALLVMAVVMVVPQMYNDFYNNCYHHAYELLKKTPSTQLSFQEFYSKELFEKIKQEIDYQGEWSAAYGMHPAVLQYNGIATLDGYLGLYSEEYKKQFGRLIAPALKESEEFAATFQNSGIRAYLYSGAGENTYVPVKNFELKDQRLFIDKEVFAEMQGVYIFSRIEISNEEEVGLSLLKAFSDTSSPYTIYVYKKTLP